MMKLDKRLLHQARVARFELGATIGLGVLSGFTLVIQARAISIIVNGVFLFGWGLWESRKLLLLFLLLSAIRVVLTWGGEVAAQGAAGRIKHALRHRLVSHLLALGPAHAHRERSGELINTVVGGVETLEAYFSQYLPQLAIAAFVPLTILGFVFPLDLTTALILFLTAPLIPLFMVLIGDAADRITRRQWKALSRLSAHFLDVLQGLTSLKLLGRSRDQVRTIAVISDRYRRTTLGVLRVTFLSALVLEMIATISIAVVAVEIGLRLLYGRMAFEHALFVLILAPEFYLPLRMLGTRFHAGMSGIAAAKRIFEVLDTSKPAISELHLGDQRPSRLDINIHFEKVHFVYDEGQRSAISGISFAIPSGHKVAIVGPSGSGKSTLTYLLLRFINPDRGTITIDGHPIQTLDKAFWRSKIAWVPQQPYLFHASVAENIRLARPEADIERVIQAAEKANAHDFIKRLPQGYDSPIGERGSRLSGGQAQSIALARAFLKDAPFLILDEPMANLDPVQEARVQEAVNLVLEDRTALIVAHRLGTVRDADAILVMVNGRLEETGTHEALLAEKGLYHQLITTYGGMT